MPVKQRTGKRRTMTEEQEQRAWLRFFMFGRDYLEELEPLGLSLRHGITPATAPAVRRAWRRFGDELLLTRDASPWPDRTPWALREFGEPSSCR